MRLGDRAAVAPTTDGGRVALAEPVERGLQRTAALVAFALAILALVASIVAAAGPADVTRSAYEWPPQTLPSDAPGQGWYAPLPLLNRVPESLELTIPCGLSPALRDSTNATVLATARRPRATDALSVRLVRDRIRIAVGRQALGTMPWPASCPLVVELRDGTLRLPAETVSLRADTLDRMPIVTGLFSGLDLRQGEPPHVTVQTRPYETSQTTRQRIAVILAVLLAVSAMLLASYRRRASRGRLSVARAMRAAWGARDPTDWVVVGVLLVWWIVAPTFFDDGWVWTEHQAFDDVGAMDYYFDVWGSQLPLGYWIEWLRNWVLGPTSELVYLRLPALVALAACWFVCRWCLGRVVLGPRPRFTRWLLAGGFLVGALAWGMTLRLEPFLALLTLVVLAAALSFAATPRLAPLAIAVSAAALAVNIHPAGLVACAPLFAVVPEAGRWLRANGRWTLIALGAVVVGASAISIVAFTLDADLELRLIEARASRTNDPFASAWWQEYVRYERFDQNGGRNAVRHLSLGLLFLTLLAWASRRRNTETNVLLVPARSVALALALLAFVPSKWPWHFGALLGIGAVALAAEATRLAREPVVGGRSSIRPVVALAGAVAVALWSWEAAAEWSRVDLQVMEWTQVFGLGGYPWQLAAATVAAVVTPLVVVLRRRSAVLPSPSAGAQGVVAIACFACVGLTCVVLALDAVRSSWSPARQNLEALVGGDCGLADELDGSRALLLPLVSGQAPVLLDPEVALYFPCATIPRIEGGRLEIPRLVVVPPYRWLLEDKDAPFSALPDLYELKRVAAGTGGIEVLSVTDDLDYVRVDAVHRRPRE